MLWAETGPGKDGTLRTSWGSGSRPVRSSYPAAGGTPLGGAVGRAPSLGYTSLSTPALGDVMHRGGRDPHTNLTAWKTLIKGGIPVNKHSPPPEDLGRWQALPVKLG